MDFLFEVWLRGSENNFEIIEVVFFFLKVFEIGDRKEGI